MSEEEKKQIDAILDRYGFAHDALIGVLQEIQKAENYLSREVLQYVSQKMEVPLTQIYQIATFYKSFSLTPKGRHQIKVCTGTACHLKGAAQNTEEIRRRLGIGEGKTTQDLTFSFETVNCLGTCALAPVIVIDNDYYDSVTPATFRRILKNYSKNDGQ